MNSRSASSRPAAPASGVFLLFVTLLLFWVLLNGSLAVDVLLVGTVAAAVIAFLFRGHLAWFSELRLTPQALLTTLAYVVYYLKALVSSNLNVAAIVLSPDLPVNPGIVTVRTKLKTAMGRMLLANSITLTPGTLTVDMEGDLLHIHWVTVDSPDIEVATQAIVAGFERYLEVMYG
jgi:multicomponent Na+:H+ antiporter subunit E